MIQAGSPPNSIALGAESLPEAEGVE